MLPSWKNISLCGQKQVISVISKNSKVAKIYKNSTVKISELSMAFENLLKLLKKILSGKF